MIPIPELTPSDIVRLWSGIDVRGPADCWPWLRTTVGDGYGRLMVNSQNYVATRIIWRHWHGIDPGDLLVCHTCNNPPCCNPNHLFLGDWVDNTNHAFSLGRRFNRGQFHPGCKLSEDDLKIINESDLSNSVLATQLSVTPSRISQIRRGRG